MMALLHGRMGCLGGGPHARLRRLPGWQPECKAGSLAGAAVRIACPGRVQRQPGPACQARLPSLPPRSRWHPPGWPSTAQVIGAIDGSGRVVLKDRNAPADAPVPVDLDLEKVLGDMPNKTFR